MLMTFLWLRALCYCYLYTAYDISAMHGALWRQCTVCYDPCCTVRLCAFVTQSLPLRSRTFTTHLSRILTHPHSSSRTFMIQLTDSRTAKYASRTTAKPHAPPSWGHSSSRTYTQASRTSIHTSRTLIIAAHTLIYASLTLVCALHAFTHLYMCYFIDDNGCAICAQPKHTLRPYGRYTYIDYSG